jgi:hypothetical protein
VVGRPGLAGTWYRVSITPGSASPVKLAPLPIKPLSDVAAQALSGSGQDLAILTAPSLGGEKRLCVFSVATGDLLQHCWSNLMTGSQVIWSQTPANPDASDPCDGGYVTVSADGKTVSCGAVYSSGVSGHSPGRWRLAWLTYPTSAAADRGGAPVVDYQLRVPAPTRPLSSGSPLWADPSGTALLAEWSLGGTHFGVLSHGRFTPLPVPPAADPVTAIAW